MVEVCHNVRRASLSRLLKPLSEPLREAVWCLRVGSSAGRVLRPWGPVHHDRSDVFLPVSESDGMCSSLQIWGVSNVLTTFRGFHFRSCTMMDTPACSKIAFGCMPIVSPCRETRIFVHGAIPGTSECQTRPLKPIMCAFISSLMSRILCARRALSTS